MADYATQQKTLRAKANKSTVDTSKLEHFEKFEVGAKTTFALLGDMAGKLFSAQQPAPGNPKLSREEFATVGKELFEDLCAAIDLQPTIIGQCINAIDKQIIDSRPKKIKHVKVDSATAAQLERDNMGETDAPAASASSGGASATSKKAANKSLVKRENNNTGAAGDEDDERAGSGAADAVLTAEDLERLAAEEKQKAEAEAREREAIRAALLAEENKRLMQEENERRLKEQARKVTAEVPIGMKVMSKDDDDDMFAGFAGKGGKKGGKGGKR